MIPHGLAGDSPCYQSEIKSTGDCEATEDRHGGIFLVLTRGRDLELIHSDSTAWGPPEESGTERQSESKRDNDSYRVFHTLKFVRPHPANEKNAVFVHLCVQTLTRQ